MGRMITANREMAAMIIEDCPLMDLEAPFGAPVAEAETEADVADEEDMDLEEARVDPDKGIDEARTLVDTDTEEDGAVALGLGVTDADRERDTEETGAEAELEPE